MPKLCAFSLAIVGLILTAPATAPAAIPDLIWQDVEGVDANVSDLPSGSGASIVFFDGVWHLVYVKAGQVWLARRTVGGWLPPLAMTQSQAIPSDPHLAVGGTILHLVWQDDRAGHPEVYARRYAGGSWTAEACLTSDAVPSLAPVIAGLQSNAMVVWQEETGSAARIRGRYFSGGMWGLSEPVSLGNAAATEPAISSSEDDWGYASFYIAWTDARHGDPEIYLRMRGSAWWAEERMTNLAGECRRPSIHNELCCSDYIMPACLVAFEYAEPGGVTEIWAASKSYDMIQVGRLSPDDGIPSILPNASGNAFLAATCFFGGGFPRYWVTWADQTATASRSVSLVRTGENPPPIGIEQLAAAAVGRSVVGGGEDSPDRVMIAWCEPRDGVPTLVARSGIVPNCFIAGLRPSPSLLVAPEGVPSNVLQRIDTCTGDDLAGAGELFGLVFSPALDGAITWDPLQEHPQIGAETNQQGQVVFSVRGGGCSQAGPADVLCAFYGPPEASYDGVRSPDVDGDCAVRLNDLQYVQSRIGTGDYCADLDGSGWVDAADLAIVQATLGDHCGNVTNVEALGQSAFPALSAVPNPARTAMSLRLSGAAEGGVLFRIVDVEGRLVRSALAETKSGFAAFTWDTRDDLGRPAASGIYSVQAGTGDHVVRRSILVLR